MDFVRNIMVTGGAGFIGSNLVRLLLERHPDYRIINVDKLTYAGNLANLEDVAGLPNYVFVKADICDYPTMLQTMRTFGVDGVINLAAESHVDRSISDPFTFARTNVMGTLSLLQAAKEFWQPNGWTSANGVACRFYHISTDEVYGALEMNHPDGTGSPFSLLDNARDCVYGDSFFTESTRYNPHSPYSAAKASSDHFVRAFHDTYGMPVVVTNCSNNYGPYQFPEKLIPLFINNIRHRRALPVYGSGQNVRDWLYVGDHADAIDLVFHKGKDGRTYNIGGFNEWKNIDLVRLLVSVTDRLLGREEGEDLDLITFVGDRAGHDLRYAIDPSRLYGELGWQPSVTFAEGLEMTVKWYLEHQDWLDDITSGEYVKYYEQMYGSFQ